MKKLLVIATLIVYTAISSTNVIEAAEMNNAKIENTLHEHRFLTRGKLIKKENMNIASIGVNVENHKQRKFDSHGMKRRLKEN